MKEEELLKKQEEETPQKSRSAKALVLLVSPFIPFACYYVFGIPQYLSFQLIQRFDLSQKEFNLNFTYYYLFSIIGLFLGPFLLKKLNGAGVSVIMSSVGFFGSFLCYLSVFQNNYILMLIGRSLLGPASEISLISCYVVLEDWFKGGILTFSYSFVDFLLSLSESVSSYVTLPVYKKTRELQTTFFLCSAISAVSVFFAVIIMIVDSRSRKIEELRIEDAETKKKRYEEMSMEDDEDSNLTEALTFKNSLVI